MIAVVTGSNGLLGQKIIEQLNNKDYKIIATSKGPNKNSNLPKPMNSTVALTQS